MAVPPFIEVFDERFAKCIAQEQLGDDLVLSIELCLGLAGDAEKPGEGEVDDPANPGTRIFQKGLEDIIFFPTRFILNTKLTDIFKKWYPGGLPFTETTLTITWDPDVKLPVVCFIRNRSYITLVMPFPKEGEFLRLKGTGHFPGPAETVSALLRKPTREDGEEKKEDTLAYFHYMFGFDKTLTDEQQSLTLEEQEKILLAKKRTHIKNCIRAMIWDPRGFLHAIDEVKQFEEKDKEKDEDKWKRDKDNNLKKIGMPRKDDSTETGGPLKATLRRMNMTLQISVTMMEEGEDGTAREPILPSCNVGQAVYDPVAMDFVLNGQHYTAANWPQH